MFCLIPPANYITVNTHGNLHNSALYAATLVQIHRERHRDTEGERETETKRHTERETESERHKERESASNST